MHEDPAAVAEDPSPVTPRSAPFAAYLVAQFLGALNDNLFKFTITSLITFQVARDASREGFLLGLAQALFAAPFILAATLCGSIADRFSKSSVMVAAKVLEIGVMVTAVAAFATSHVPTLLALLLVMGFQSTMFAPAKYGYLPERLDARDISRANGLVLMTTFVAIGSGGILGGLLFDAFSERLHVPGLVFVGLGIAGLLCARRIPPVAPAAPGQALGANPLPWLARVAVGLRGRRTLLFTIAGIAHFYVVVAAMQVLLVPYGKEAVGLRPTGVGLLQTTAVVGIAAGSLLAARWSGGRIELGLVPLGACGLSVAIVALGLPWGGVVPPFVLVLALGASAGLFIVPLQATLQHESPAGERGRFIAFGNFVSFVGVLLSGGLILLLRGELALEVRAIALAIGTASLVAAVGTGLLLPGSWRASGAWLRARGWRGGRA